MVQIFTTGNPYGMALPDLDGMRRQAAYWESVETIDMVLLGYSSLWPQNFVTASMITSMTSRLAYIVAHRPGVMHAAAAASAFGAMDYLSNGRIAINLVSGSSEKDLHREGDYLPKIERYDRADDYVTMMKRCWNEPRSFDYQSKYIKAEGVKHLMRPLSGQVPIFMGGESDEAIEFGARQADTYMLWGEPIAGTRERIERVKAAAARHGRSPKFSLSLRLFLGDTDEAAWTQAREVEQAVIAADGSGRFLKSSATDTSVGRDRQLKTAASERHDDCFWTGLVKLLGGFANSAALVGTPDRVMASLKAYRDLGIDAFLITAGFDGFWEPSLEDFSRRMKREL